MSEQSKMDYLTLAVAILAFSLSIAGVVLPESATIEFENLDGISISSPFDNQILMYNSTSSNWSNANMTTYPTIQAGKSTPFNTTNAGIVTDTLTFSEAFTSTPIIILSLDSISNSSVIINSVQSCNVTTTDFDASALITTGGNGTAVFSYIAFLNQ